VLLFPLLLPIWQKHPLTLDDLYPEPAPVRITRGMIALQHQALQRGGVDLRCRIAVALGDTHHPAAARLLIDALDGETDPRVAATILTQLRRFEISDAYDETHLRTFLRHPDASVRAAAVRLYARLPNADPLLLTEIAEHESVRTVRRTAWRVIADRSMRLSPAFFAKFRHDPDPVVRTCAVRSLVRSGADSARKALLDACRDADPTVRCAVAAHVAAMPARLASEAVHLLAGDANSAVRAETASAIPRLRDPALLPVLTSLCGDPDAEVRRRAVAGCAAFPRSAAAESAAQALADSANLVREAATSALARLHARGVSVEQFVAPHLDATSPYVRGAAYRTLGAIEARSFASRLAQALDKEKDAPPALAGVVHACGRLGLRSCAAAIARYAAHPDVAVRIEVAGALGRLPAPETVPAMVRLAGDVDVRVRREAFRGMAAGGDGVYSRACLAILERVHSSDYITPDDRAWACWCAGRLHPADPALVRRLVLHATTPVVPVTGGKMFDADHVLVSAMFALVEIARRDAAFRPDAQKVIDALGREVDPGNVGGLAPGILVPSPALQEYARQAAAYLDGKSVAPRRRPLGTPRLPLLPLETEADTAPEGAGTDR